MYSKVFKALSLRKNSLLTRNFSDEIKKTKIFHSGGHFDELLSGRYVFADKSLFIRSILNRKNLLITRPRRWGKSLNLDMVRSFFSPKVFQDGTYAVDEQKKDAFKKLKIGKLPYPENPFISNSKEKKIIDLQGTVPVFKVTFDDIASPMSTKDIDHQVADMLIDSVMAHSYLLKSSKVDSLVLGHLMDAYNNGYKGYESLSYIAIAGTIKILISAISAHFNSKVIVLIDEYDKFLVSLADQNNELYDHGLGLYTKLLSPLKSSESIIQLSILVGVSKLGKTSVLSGLNAFTHDSVQAPQTEEFFGLTENEIETLISEANELTGYKLDEKDIKETLKERYNGYKIGSSIIYNPYSIMNSLYSLADDYAYPESKKKEKENIYLNYWANSGSTKILDDSFKYFSNEKEIESLIKEGFVNFRPVDSYIMKIENDLKLNNPDLDSKGTDLLIKTLCADKNVFLTFMLDTGYLTHVKKNEYKIPNKEVSETFLKRLIPLWLGLKYPTFHDNQLDDSHIEDIKFFCESIQKNILDKTIPNDDPEHLFQDLIYFSLLNQKSKLANYLAENESSYNTRKRMDLILLPIEKRSETLFVLELKKEPNKPTNTEVTKNNENDAINEKKNIIKLRERLENSAIHQIMERYTKSVEAILEKENYIKKITLRAVVFVLEEGKWIISAKEITFDVTSFTHAVKAFNSGLIPKQNLFEVLDQFR
jgi:hypothetical protein